MLALCDIGNRANKFQLPGLILIPSMADNMNILDRTIGHQQPVLEIEIPPCVATGPSALPPSSRVRHGFCEAAARSHVSPPRCVPYEMPSRHNWPPRTA